MTSLFCTTPLSYHIDIYGLQNGVSRILKFGVTVVVQTKCKSGPFVNRLAYLQTAAVFTERWLFTVFTDP